MFVVERCLCGGCWRKVPKGRFFCSSCNPLVPADIALAMEDHFDQATREAEPALRLIIRNSVAKLQDQARLERWREQQRRWAAEREARETYGDDAIAEEA